MKKIISLLLVLLLLSTLVACQGSTDTKEDGATESNDKQTTDTQSKDTDTEVTGELAYDGTWGTKLVSEPTTIKIFARQDGNFVVDPEAEFWVKYSEMTGVTIEGTANPNVETITDLNIHATDRFPSDIISVGNNGAELERYAAEGALLDLNDYLDYMPNLQAFLKTDLGKQAYEASLTDEGKFYLIPAVERFKPTHIPMIRKDWLDKVGLEVPQTTEELYTALKAFKDQDLGNGLTIPFLAKTWVLKQNSPVLFGARIETRPTGRLVNDENGTFTHGWLSDEFRTMMVEYSKWYDEGILAQDVFTADKPLEEHFPTDQGGFTYYSASNMGFNDQPDMPEGFELVPMLPTAYNENGDRLEQRATHFLRKGRIGISVSSENPVLAAKVIDTLLSTEGAMAQRYGFEGTQYALDQVTEDGISVYRFLPEWEEKVLNEYNNDMNQALLENGYVNIGLSQDAYYDQTRVIKSDEVFGKSVIDEIEEMYLDAFADGTVTFIPAITMSFSPDDTTEISNIKGALETFQDEFFETSIVEDYTKLDQAWWDEYVASSKELGVDRLVEIYNNAQ